MRTLTLPGCWYADNTPAGDYAAAVFGLPIARTSHGDVTGREVQWLRISPDGRQFAATGAQNASAWAWDGQHWQEQGPFVGPRAVLYRPDGSLYVERVGGWPGPGSQGWRYVDDAGRMVPSWETYDSLSAEHVWEHTTRRDVTIGQGPGGVVALVGGHRKRLDRLFALGDAPACYAVNFTRQGDDYAVAWYVAHSPVSYTACLLWLTDAELRALPDEAAPTPSPDPAPDPEPIPEPEEPVSVPNLLDLVKTERAKYGPVPSDVELGRMLNAIAWRGNGNRADGPWGLSVKPSGTNCPAPDGTLIAHDILHHKPTDTLWDVLEAAGAQATPTWGQVEHHRNPQRPWKAPLPPMGGDEDDPGDSDERPGPGPVMDPRLLPIAQELTVVAVRLDESIAALRAITPAPTPEPHECPRPRWPDDHECPEPGPVTSLTEPDAQAARRGWERIWRGPLPGDLLTFLLYRLLVEAAPAEDLDVEVQRRRGQ